MIRARAMRERRARVRVRRWEGMVGAAVVRDGEAEG